MRARKKHYNIYGADEKQYGVSLCGMMPKKENLTSIAGCVTCKHCLRLIKSKQYSISQFVKER